MQEQEKPTHLPPAFAGALTLVSDSKAEAAGTAERVWGVKIEGPFPTSITPDPSNISLQTWRQWQRESQTKNTKKQGVLK